MTNTSGGGRLGSCGIDNTNNAAVHYPKGGVSSRRDRSSCTSARNNRTATLIDTFLFTLDLIGTFVFALSGATLGVRYKLDLFGVLVLSVAAATAGGIVRDVLIGAVPPAAMSDWRYFGVAFLAGLLTFFQDAAIERLRNPVMLFDAIGLGLCAATGANKALDHGLAAGFAIFLGMLSGIGGGIARDVFVARIPVVLRSEFYAVAALFGAAVVVLGHRLGLPREPVMIAGASLCFVLRFIAIRRGWRLPVAQQTDDSGAPERSKQETGDDDASSSQKE